MLLEWMEYERLEPFGQWRDNFHAAQIALILASAHTDPSRREWRMDDFFFRDRETAAEQADQSLLGILRARRKPNGKPREIPSGARAPVSSIRP